MTPLAPLPLQSPVAPDALAGLRTPLVRAGLAVVAVGWHVVEPAASRVVRRRNRNNPTIVEATSRYVRLVVVVVAADVGASAGGYGRLVGGSALVTAAATLAVGVAGQRVGGSLVSGLAPASDPEFDVEDYVEWPDREGEARSITLRVTRVETPGGDLVTVPNTTLTDGAVVRPYGRGQRQRVTLAYGDDLDAALAQLRAAVEGLEEAVDSPPPAAYVDELEPGAVDVHYWIADPDRQDVYAARSAYARAALDRLDDAGIAVSPPPKRELQGRVTVDEVEPAGETA